MHLSGEMSGTFESAQLAARDALAPGARRRHPAARDGHRVRRARRRGRARRAAGRARRRPAPRWPGPTATTSLFYVDTLEYLRRGGRIGAAAALLGSALAVKPLLEIVDGRIATREKVRTTARALSRLEELAVAAAGDRQVDVAVAHLANPDRAERAGRAPAPPAGGQPRRPGGLGRRGRRRASAPTSGPGMVAVVRRAPPDRAGPEPSTAPAAAALSTGRDEPASGDGRAAS